MADHPMWYCREDVRWAAKGQWGQHRSLGRPVREGSGRWSWISCERRHGRREPNLPKPSAALRSGCSRWPPAGASGSGMEEVRRRRVGGWWACPSRPPLTRAEPSRNLAPGQGRSSGWALHLDRGARTRLHWRAGQRQTGWTGGSWRALARARRGGQQGSTTANSRSLDPGPDQQVQQVDRPAAMRDLHFLNRSSRFDLSRQQATCR